MPGVHPAVVTPFLLGAAITAAVSWVAWPSAPAAAPAASEPRHMRSIGRLQLSPSESIEAVAIPNPDQFTSTVCVIYRSDANTLMECPARDAIDLDGYSPVQ